MCGIAGFIKYKELPTGWGRIEAMTAAIEHRGPDAKGFYENGNVALGHNRLSIIDLSECANQPMSDFSARYRIVFNGEIYNYKEVKSKLNGYPYVSGGDTEVILAAYLEWGPDCVVHLAGMFAFAIWDNLERQLFIARDRLGVKPLYYYESDEGFLFASEIRSLLASGLIERKVNLTAVSGFLQFQSVGFPETIVQGIQSVAAGCYMVVNSEGKTTRKYWNITGETTGFNYKNGQEVKEKLRQLLKQAVKRRMVSDVPIAAFLSGGIDSSAVVGLMTSLSAEPVNTFTVGFREKEFDESVYAETISKKFNTRHRQIILKPENFLEDLLPALNAMDTPTGDGVNSYVVCKAIRENGIKVALSGVGGDELFAGYPIFLQYLKLMKCKKMWKAASPVRQLVRQAIGRSDTKQDRFKQLLRAKSASVSSFYPVFRQIVSERLLFECTMLPAYSNNILLEYEDQIKKLPLLSQISVAEYLGYTQHTLLKDMDQMSMASSLEVREPFFDHDLIEFVLQIPDDQKFPYYPKKLLVDTLGDMLPYEIVHRKKQGFLFPWKEWMRNELKDFCESHLHAIAERDFIKRDGVMNAWKRFLKGDPSIRWMEIWLFVVLEYWLSKNNVS